MGWLGSWLIYVRESGIDDMAGFGISTSSTAAIASSSQSRRRRFHTRVEKDARSIPGQRSLRCRPRRFGASHGMKLRPYGFTIADVAVDGTFPAAEHERRVDTWARATLEALAGSGDSRTPECRRQSVDAIDAVSRAEGNLGSFWSLRWRSVLADERTGERPAVSSIRRTRRTSSSISWTCGVKYLPDFHTDERGNNCKRYVGVELPQSMSMNSGIRPQLSGMMPFAGKVIIPG